MKIIFQARSVYIERPRFSYHIESHRFKKTSHSFLYWQGDGNSV